MRLFMQCFRIKMSGHTFFKRSVRGVSGRSEVCPEAGGRLNSKGRSSNNKFLSSRRVSRVSKLFRTFPCSRKISFQMFF